MIINLEIKVPERNKKWTIYHLQIHLKIEGYFRLEIKVIKRNKIC